MFTIEKDVPVPVGGTRRKYPFPDMEVGDSFFIADPLRVQSLRFAASYWGKRHGTQFSVRREGTGCRCWRIK